jgi:dolichol-phosphate mannosyltransferase
MSAGMETIVHVDDDSALPSPVAGRGVEVADFDRLEHLVARGADSARVAVVPPDRTVIWKGDGPYVPTRPYSFPWRCLVVLPTYNERENLARMTAMNLRYLDADILVVDDDSPDGTGRIADELSVSNARVHALHRHGERGLGRAYVAGFTWALERGYDRVIEMDCDFSHAAWDLPRLVHASVDADLVIGSRYVRGGSTEGWTFARRLLSRGGNLYASLILGGAVHDWTAGFRVFRAGLLRRIDLERVGADGYGFQIEMAWRALRAGATIREIPIRFSDRESGRSKMNRSIAFEAIRMVPGLRLRSPAD